MLPGLGASAPSGGKASIDCGREEFVSGLEAVFGRRKTQAQANVLRTTVIRRGFVNANIIPGCDGFRVVIRGIDTFTIGVELQSEARREGFPVTLECIKAKEIGRLEAIFTHTRDRAAANAYIDRAAAFGLPGAEVPARSLRRLRGVPRRFQGSRRSRGVPGSGEARRLQRRPRAELARQ